tara:strand:- start:29720 stop:30502 length:783 start_codon:yes stop_codon:yes gene_type:complete
MNNRIAIAVVGDFRYLRKHFATFFSELRENGNFDGEILVITSFFTPTILIKKISKKNKVKVLRFPKIKFSSKANSRLSDLETNKEPNRHLTKNFQWHKLNLFDEKIKLWRYVFYLDINMHIHHDINKILAHLPNNQLFARSDGYPDYKRTLETQFDKTTNEFQELKKEYNLTIENYFQTGLLYFDTEIIKSQTKKDLINLVEKYPITLTNEQGIMNLYFIFHNDFYEELLEKVDDYISYYYWMVNAKKIIITKQLREKYK